ncbi:hypothetical protein AVEN_37451-1 [Araneus ventricosus]|uniref:Uncharacterized protein n=1 Tax=Araneus ventricosus TaxID=182803 RepID=A0A4Y2FGI5_ARAVE|nr:hypothetical protein AVEN_37451-1 [Araneus ventricosus]
MNDASFGVMDDADKFLCEEQERMLITDFNSSGSLVTAKSCFIFLDDMKGSSHVWTPDLGDKFGGEIWDLKGAEIFSISLLGEEIRLNVLDDSM